jgi:hypothetical protein
MANKNRPSIFRVGKIIVNGVNITISGWGLGLCMLGCECHRSPEDGQLQIKNDQQNGTLGLVNFLSMPCDCCEPWTANELAIIADDCAGIQDDFSFGSG